jgi:leucyl aminopeptidase
VISVDVVAAKGLPAEFKGDAVALGVFEREEKGKVPELFIGAKRIDAKAGGILAESVKRGEFTGKLGSVSTYHVKQIPARLILLIGLGKRSEFEPDAVRQAAAKACCAARELGAKKIAFSVDSVAGRGVDLEAAGRLLAEGAILGLYRFEAYKTEKEKKEVESLHLLTSGSAKAVAEGARNGEAVASSANLAREICNDPGNYATPEKLAKLAQGIAAKYGFKCKVLGKREIEKEKMGGILSVSAGSHQPPAFVILEYNGPKSAGKKPVVLIGKGITFD